MSRSHWLDRLLEALQQGAVFECLFYRVIEKLPVCVRREQAAMNRSAFISSVTWIQTLTFMAASSKRSWRSIPVQTLPEKARKHIEMCKARRKIRSAA